MKKSYIRRVSKKRAAELKTYSTLRKQFLTSNPTCELCEAPSEHVHHKAKRGKRLNDVEWWMAVCFNCHERIENNKTWARANGHLLNISDL